MISINIRQSNDKKVQVECEPESTTIEQFKKLVEEKTEIPVEEQRLIFSGRVLKETSVPSKPDEQPETMTVAKYKILDGHTVHLVRGKKSTSGAPAVSSTSAPTPSQTSVPNPQPQQQAAQNAPQMPFGFPGGVTGAGDAGLGANSGMFSMMSQMLEQNPQLFESMIAQNPMLQQMGMSPEQARQVINDPFFRQVMNNPQMLSSIMQMQQQFGGGMMGAAPQQGTQPNSQNNPESQPSQQLPPLPMPMMDQAMLQSLMGGMGAGAAPQQPANLPPPEVRFQTQLQQLQEMGFHDASANIRALLATGGNVNAAIEYLFNQGQ